ncbi:hypothetical protein CBL_10960 [Carabus blaptoides fortunei]
MYVAPFVWTAAAHPLKAGVATGTGERLACPTSAECGRLVPMVWVATVPLYTRQPANTRVPTTGHRASSQSGVHNIQLSRYYITHTPLLGNIER